MWCKTFRACQSSLLKMTRPTSATISTAMLPSWSSFYAALRTGVLSAGVEGRGGQRVILTRRTALNLVMLRSLARNVLSAKQ